MRGYQKEEDRIFKNFVGKSQVMRDIFNKVVKLADSDANVMIYGETGSGKELLARSLHALSLRRSGEFVPVDFVAMPETLIESELFGYEKGAFTGADSERKGLLEYAHKGTLFLDEICELPPLLQAKLLRVLQEREFRRVGGKSLIKVDLRIISATNKRPLIAVKRGQLREDLYYRLNVIPFELPPLRLRKEDIPSLFEIFLSQLNRAGIEVTRPALKAMTNYQWPGNVRELKNLAERVVSFLDGQKIQLADLPDYIACKVNSINSKCALRTDLNLPLLAARKQVLRNFEKEYLINLLQECPGNISRAAKVAQISRRTLYRLLKIHNLEKLIKD